MLQFTLIFNVVVSQFTTDVMLHSTLSMYISDTATTGAGTVKGVISHFIQSVDISDTATTGADTDTLLVVIVDSKVEVTQPTVGDDFNIFNC